MNGSSFAVLGGKSDGDMFRSRLGMFPDTAAAVVAAVNESGSARYDDTVTVFAM